MFLTFQVDNRCQLEWLGTLQVDYWLLVNKPNVQVDSGQPFAHSVNTLDLPLFHDKYFSTGRQQYIVRESLNPASLNSNVNPKPRTIYHQPMSNQSKTTICTIVAQ